MHQLILRGLAVGIAVHIAFGQAIELVPVRSETLHRTISLPGELLPFQQATLYARANGFVEKVLVDRGSQVRQGQLLVQLSAPELAAGIAELEAKKDAAASVQAEAEAKLKAAQALRNRLKAASATPGAIAPIELQQAEQAVEAVEASVKAAASGYLAAEAASKTSTVSELYSKVTAPFSGVITERYAHPGALAGPSVGTAGKLLELQQVSRLRLVVALPEAGVAGVRRGTRVDFNVPAFPGRTFTGTVARLNRSLDAKTRTMAVELDVLNSKGDLSPGMFPEVTWPTGGVGTLVVPSSAVVTTTERTFVIRSNEGHAEWVNVRKGAVTGDSVAVQGSLAPGDLIVRKASDEIRERARLQTRR